MRCRSIGIVYNNVRQSFDSVDSDRTCRPIAFFSAAPTVARSAMPSSRAAETVVTPLLEIGVGGSWSAQSCDGRFERVGVDRPGDGGPADGHPPYQPPFDGIGQSVADRPLDTTGSRG